MIKEQNNMKVKETKVKNVRYNPSRAGNTVNIYIFTSKYLRISPLHVVCVSYFSKNTTIKFHCEILIKKELTNNC